MLDINKKRFKSNLQTCKFVQKFFLLSKRDEKIYKKLRKSFNKVIHHKKILFHLWPDDFWTKSGSLTATRSFPDSDPSNLKFHFVRKIKIRWPETFLPLFYFVSILWKSKISEKSVHCFVDVSMHCFTGALLPCCNA